MVDLTLHFMPSSTETKKWVSVSVETERMSAMMQQGIDPTIVDLINDLFVTITLGGTEPMAKVLALMNKNMETIKNTNATQIQKDIGTIAYSIGMESFKQWYEIFNDKTSAFHPKRRLQLFPDPEDGAGAPIGDDLSLDNDVIAEIIGGDIVGAVEEALDQLFSGEPLNPTLILGFSVGASLRSYLDEVTTIDDDECFFPNNPLCNDDDTDANPEPCLFPNSPLCDNDDTVVVVDDVDDTDANTEPCLFPNSPLCNNSDTVVDVAGDITNGDNIQDTIDGIIGDGGNNDEVIDENGDEGSNDGEGVIDVGDVDPIGTFCNLFPNSPQCQETARAKSMVKSP